MSDMTAAPEAALRPPVALSVVIPVYRSGEIFPALHRRLTAALVPLGNYEIIAVVDGGGDETAEIIARHCAADPRLKMAEMSRNFGEEAAVSAGLALAKGELVLVMDDDLEDPPEEIPRFVAKAEEGYDVVYGIIARREVSAFRGTAFRLFYRTLNFLTDIKMPNDAGSFCLMRRPVVDALNAMPENNRYIRGMRVWIGYRQTGLPYERHERAGGVSGYTFTKYLRFGVNAILSFSHKPLDYVVGLGMLVSLFAFAEG
ncbi:MAG: glycosyltransferase family 2 protein, partial [Nitrospinae bacterium]|nr:glycosyltransferase family 2 protein [Nitrospinota bacterium]